MRKPGMRPGAGKKSMKESLKIIRRIFSYITAKYKLAFAVVIIGILIGTVANVIGSLFLEVLIDDYIIPLTGMDQPVFSGLLKAISIMAMIYFIGVLSTLVYN